MKMPVQHLIKVTTNARYGELSARYDLAKNRIVELNEKRLDL